MVPVEKDGIEEYLKAASSKLNISLNDMTFIKILNKALDARDHEQFYYELSIAVRVPDDFSNTEDLPRFFPREERRKKIVRSEERPVIIGFGPAGMFAALEFVENGLRPLIFERGKKIEERAADIARFIKERELDPESNIQFGEGGAGSFSDGKVFSRAKNTVYVARVLETLIKFGAPEEIGYTKKPHIGTDVLCLIVANIRNYILEHGGEVFYRSKMTDLLIKDNKAVGVVINGGREYHSSMIFLAVGHSSRDTFEMINNKNVAMEQKAISVGVRIEHPVETINLLRYGDKYKDFRGVGAASYSVTYTDRKKERGVYTFCMCPGGEVVNASSENGLMVVNGMSYSARNSEFSNAGIVVTCHTDDYGSAHPLAGIEFQRDIERKAFLAGGPRWEVPAQRLPDFLKGRASGTINRNSCLTGVIASDLNSIFPEFVRAELCAAFAGWKDANPLFVSDEATLLAPETRTSCPVKIIRNEGCESVSLGNLYPIGEGSGYSGGISSSAADALKAVESCLSRGI
jgi:uncharacterized protein